MKTIEERAREYASDELNPNYAIQAYIASKQQKAYIAGATEQKAIDIDKTCEWITEHIDILYEGEFIDNSPVASDYIEWCKKRLEYAKEITDEFRKVMEK